MAEQGDPVSIDSRCTCGEINSRHCPVHNDPPQQDVVPLSAEEMEEIEMAAQIAALLPYLQHKPGCGRSSDEWREGDPLGCTCGLSSLMEQK